MPEHESFPSDHRLEKLLYTSDRQRLFWLGKIVLTAVAAWMLWRVFAESSTMPLAFISIREHLVTLVLVLLCGAIFSALKIYKWLVLLQSDHANVSFAVAARSYLIGLFFGIVTPGRIGEVMRVFHAGGINRLRGTVLVFVDKLLELAAIVSLIYFSAIRLGNVSGVLAVSLLAFLFLVALAFWQREVCKRLLYKVLPLRYHTALEDYSRLPSVSLHLWVVNYVVYLVGGIEFFLLVRIFSPLDFPTTFAIACLVMGSNILSLTIGNIGPREGIAIYFLAAYGFAEAQAAMVSLCLFVLNTLPPATVGFMLFLFSRRSRHAIDLSGSRS